jgi:hypothetical protein
MNDRMFRAYPTIRPHFTAFMSSGYREMRRRHRLKFGSKMTSAKMYEKVGSVLAEAYVADCRREMMT